jgi:hypothetical protein
MTIVTPTGITGINSITSLVNDITFSTANGGSLTANGLSFTNLQTSSINGGPISGTRNRIINGDMRIDQRNAGASVTLSGSYSLDRWIGNVFGTGAVSVQRVTDAPPGFSNSLRLTVTTTNSSVTGDNYTQIYQVIEGFNAADLAWGTANAQSVTASFWVKSSATGSYGFGFRDQTAAHSYVVNFQINTANTWEYKTITVPGAPIGTWGKINDIWGYLTFAPYQGPTSTGSGSTWIPAGARAATGITNTWPNTLGATFQVTGVQLEAGTVATPFERRSFGQELALCQRYYEKSFNVETAPANGSNATSFATDEGITAAASTNRSGAGTSVRFAVTKRASPTFTKFGNSSGHWRWIAPSGTAFTYNTSLDPLYLSASGFMMQQQVVDGSLVFLQGHWAAAAEL